MKTKPHILFFALLVLLLSCAKDDGVAPQPKTLLNEADEVGEMHNAALTYIGANYDLSILSDEDCYNAVHAYLSVNYSEMYPSTLMYDFEDVMEMYEGATSTFTEMASEWEMSSEISSAELEYYELMDEFIEDIYNNVYVDANAVSAAIYDKMEDISGDNTISSTQKEIILTTFSIMRHSYVFWSEASVDSGHEWYANMQGYDGGGKPVSSAYISFDDDILIRMIMDCIVYAQWAKDCTTTDCHWEAASNSVLWSWI